MASKKYYMIVDTETASEFVFDLGFTIIDRKGNEIERGSFVVSEFMTEPDSINLIEDRFSGGRKAARYYHSLFMGKGDFNIMSFAAIQHVFNDAQQRYNATVCAYNAAFDREHLDATAEYFDCGEFWYCGVQWLDIWGVALSAFCKSVNFFKWCVEHKAFTDKGNPKSGAENVYRYLMNDAEFIEAHTAYEDTKIEAAIMTFALKRKKRLSYVESVAPCFRNDDWCEMRDKWDAFRA